jgi:hypothetical protein
MAIKETVSYTMFEQRFKDSGRQDQFSPSGLRTLFDYLEELSEATDEEVELDVIALCCEFAEESLEGVLADYEIDNIEELHNHTCVLLVDHETIIFAPF